jgi:hypothetical protein
MEFMDSLRMLAPVTGRKESLSAVKNREPVNQTRERFQRRREFDGAKFAAATGGTNGAGQQKDRDANYCKQ